MIEFHLDARSGVPTYLQLVQQVHARRCGWGSCMPGDQLPTVKEVVGEPRDQPEHGAQGLPRARPRAGSSRGGAGRGRSSRARAASWLADDVEALRASLQRWIASARAAGLDDENMAALFADTRATAGVDEGGMSAALAHADGPRQALRLELGAARLHARDPGGLGDGPRRPERRRQDDAAATRGRA